PWARSATESTGSAPARPRSSAFVVPPGRYDPSRRQPAGSGSAEQRRAGERCLRRVGDETGGSGAGRELTLEAQARQGEARREVQGAETRRMGEHAHAENRVAVDAVDGRHGERHGRGGAELFEGIAAAVRGLPIVV